MVREIRGAKINPKSFFKNYGAQITQANMVFFISVSCFKCVTPPHSSSFNDPINIRLRVQVMEVIIVQFVSIIGLLFVSWVKMLLSAHSHTHICRCVIVTLPPWGNIKVESGSRLGLVACLFQSDVSIPLQPDSQCLETRNEIFEAVNHYIQEQVLQRIRKYLTAMCFLEYSLPQHLEQVCILHFFVFHRL